MRELWSQHEAAAFPRDLYDREFQGIDSVHLDAQIAGCICTALMRGQLDAGRIQILRDLGPIAASAAAAPGSADAKAYLARLGEIARLAADVYSAQPAAAAVERRSPVRRGRGR